MAVYRPRGDARRSLGPQVQADAVVRASTHLSLPKISTATRLDFTDSGPVEICCRTSWTARKEGREGLEQFNELLSSTRPFNEIAQLKLMRRCRFGFGEEVLKGAGLRSTARAQRRKHQVIIRSTLDYGDVNDFNILFWLLLKSASVFNAVDNIIPLIDSAKDGVLVVQPGRRHGGDEELTAVGIWPGISHTDSEWLVVLECAEFILELSAPDTLTTGTISKRVSTLNHKLADDSVEDGIVVITSLRMGDEVLNSLRSGIRVETNVDVAIGGMNDSTGSTLSNLLDSFLARIDCRWLLVEYISRGFGDIFTVGEHVETLLDRKSVV